MEKKYYFRGLGLGIIVTALIMGVALPGGENKAKMTDDEVIARAKELGMIEDSRLLEPSLEKNEEDGQDDAAAPVQKDNAVKKDDPVKKDTAVEREEAEEKETVSTPEPLQTETDETADAAKKPAETENPKADVGQKSSEMKPSADTNEMTKQDEDVPKQDAETKPSAGGTKSVTIASGDGSFTVAKKLAEAGVVSSADAYDDYLCANGYDKKLRTGTFKIPADADEEQVARIVTGQE